MVVDLTTKLEKYEEELAIVQTEKVRARFAQISVLKSSLAPVKTAQMRKSLHWATNLLLIKIQKFPAL